MIHCYCDAGVTGFYTANDFCSSPWSHVSRRRAENIAEKANALLPEILATHRKVWEEEFLKDAHKLFGTVIPTGEFIQWRNYAREDDVCTALIPLSTVKELK